MGESNQIYLVSRGFFKTTIGCIGFPIWLLINNPNTTIFLSCSTEHITWERILAIEHHFESNEFFREIYGDLKGFPWTRERLRVSKRKDLSNKEDSVTGGSTQSTNIGGHFDRFIFDDLVDDINSNSVKDQERVRRYWRMAQPLKKPGVTKTYVFATQWPQSVLYDDIIKTQHEFEVIERSAHEKYKREFEETSVPGLLFPGRLTEDFLESQRRVLTIDEYAAFYDIKKSDALTHMLDVDWLRMISGKFTVLGRGIGEVSWYDTRLDKWIREWVRPRLTIDPSLGKKETDPIGISLMCWGKDNMKFLVGSWRIVGGVGYATQKVASIIKNYSCYDMGVEVNGYGQFFKNSFEASLAEAKLDWLPVRALVSKGKKIDRISSLMQSPCRSGNLFVFQGENTEFMKQYESFPSCREFDVLDATAMHWAMPRCKIVTEQDVVNLAVPEKGFFDLRPENRPNVRSQALSELMMKLGHQKERQGRSQLTGY